jgi:hypothetical protein
MRTRAVVGDAGEEVADILADAVVDAQAVEVKDEVPRTNDPAADRIRQEIADLQQDIAAGDSNLRLLAEIGIKDRITRLRGTNPGLANQIQAEISQVVQASPALDALGLVDATLEAQSSAAETKIQQMYDNATKSIESGGLGMSFQTDFTNPDHVKDYVRRDKQRAAQEGADLMVGTVLATGQASAVTKLETTKNVIQGYTSKVSSALTEQMQAQREYTRELAKPANEQNAALIEARKADVEAMVFQNEAIMAEIQTVVGAIWNDPTERAGKFYQLADEMVQDKLKLMSDWNEGLASQNPQSYYDIQLAALQTEAMQNSHDNPPYRSLLKFASADPDGLIYKMISDSMTGADVLLKDQLSTIAQQAVGGLFAPVDVPDALASLYYNSGQGQITPDMTPRQIAGKLRDAHRKGDSPFGTGSEGEDEDIAAGMAQIGQVQLYLRQMLRAEADSPVAAATVLTNGTSALILYNDIGNPARDQITEAIEMLAHDSTLNGLRTAGDEQFRNTRFAFGDAAQEFLGDDNLPFSQMRTEHQQRWSGPRLGRELKDFASVNFYAEDSDYLEVDVDRKAVADATYADRAIDPEMDQAFTKASWLKHNSSTVDRNVRLIQQEVQAIVDFANNDVRATAHLNFAYNATVSGANDPSYRLYADKTGWLDALAP